MNELLRFGKRNYKLICL